MKDQLSREIMKTFDIFETKNATICKRANYETINL